MKKYYAVRKGKNPGIYKTWAECKEQVGGFSGAEFKGFASLEEAKNFINGGSSAPEQCESDAVAYVDGSFSGEQNMFSYGAVLFYNGETLTFKKSFSDSELVGMRNVAGEIKGSEFIMNYCIEHKIPSVDIYYDYEGIEKWCTGVWQASKPGTKKYRDFYLSLGDRLRVNFIKVKGHSGNEYNDMADRLAKSALNIL